jgi:hypothetical protein
MPPRQRLRCAAVTTGAISDVWTWIYTAGRWTWHDPDGYNFISGPLADITLLGGAYAIARRHNCHVKGCWRVARAQVMGTSYVVCRKHHPHDAPTAEKVIDAHNAALARRDAALEDLTQGAAAAERAAPSPGAAP